MSVRKSLLSLPTLLLVVGILGCGSKANTLSPEEEQAIAEIEKLGGQIQYESGPLTPVERVYLANTQITDADLVHLEELTELETLLLHNTQITDAGLVHLKGLTNLKTLHLNNTQVTDAGIKDLNQELPRLKIWR